MSKAPLESNTQEEFKKAVKKKTANINKKLKQQKQ